jgi:hypothetical protein
MFQLYTESEMLSRLVDMFEKERIAQNITQKERSHPTKCVTLN